MFAMIPQTILIPDGAAALVAPVDGESAPASGTAFAAVLGIPAAAPVQVAAVAVRPIAGGDGVVPFPTVPEEVGLVPSGDSPLQAADATLVAPPQADSSDAALPPRGETTVADTGAPQTPPEQVQPDQEQPVDVVLIEAAVPPPASPPPEGETVPIPAPTAMVPDPAPMAASGGQAQPPTAALTTAPPLPMPHPSVQGQAATLAVGEARPVPAPNGPRATATPLDAGRLAAGTRRPAGTRVAPVAERGETSPVAVPKDLAPLAAAGAPPAVPPRAAGASAPSVPVLGMTANPPTDARVAGHVAPPPATPQGPAQAALPAGPSDALMSTLPPAPTPPRRTATGGAPPPALPPSDRATDLRTAPEGNPARGLPTLTAVRPTSEGGSGKTSPALMPATALIGQPALGPALHPRSEGVRADVITRSPEPAGVLIGARRLGHDAPLPTAEAGEPSGKATASPASDGPAPTNPPAAEEATPGTRTLPLADAWRGRATVQTAPFAPQPTEAANTLPDIRTPLAADVWHDSRTVPTGQPLQQPPKVADALHDGRTVPTGQRLPQPVPGEARIGVTPAPEIRRTGPEPDALPPSLGTKLGSTAAFPVKTLPDLTDTARNPATTPVTAASGAADLIAPADPLQIIPAVPTRPVWFVDRATVSVSAASVAADAGTWVASPEPLPPIPVVDTRSGWFADWGTVSVRRPSMEAPSPTGVRPPAPEKGVTADVGRGAVVACAAQPLGLAPALAPVNLPGPAAGGPIPPAALPQERSADVPFGWQPPDPLADATAPPPHRPMPAPDWASAAQFWTPPVLQPRLQHSAPAQITPLAKVQVAPPPPRRGEDETLDRPAKRLPKLAPTEARSASVTAPQMPPGPTLAHQPEPGKSHPPAPLSSHLDSAQPPSPAAATPPPHALPKDLPEKLVRAAQEDRVEVLLDPVELGRVRFELSTMGDKVQVTLSVERPETLDLLRRNAEALRAEFREAGFDATTLSFSNWGSGHDEGHDPPPPTLRSDAGDDPADTAASRPTDRNMSQHGLDLRL